MFKKKEKGTNFQSTLMGMLALIAVVAVIFACYEYNQVHKKAPQISATLVETRLEDCSEIVTTRYKYNGVGIYEVPRQMLGNFPIPLTGSKLIVAYKGEMLIGTDFSDPKITIEDKVITIRYPELKILSHTIDSKSFDVWDESTGLFEDFTMDDYATFVTEQKKIQEAAAIENGVLNQECEKAKLSIQKLVSAGDISEQGYTVKVIFGEEEK